MKKFLKLFALLLAFTVLAAGCSFGVGDNDNKDDKKEEKKEEKLEPIEAMGKLYKEFEDAMDDEGYSITIEYGDGSYEKLYALGNDEFVVVIYEGFEDIMYCNVDGEYDGEYDGDPYEEYGFTEDEIIDYCEEALDHFDDKLDFVLEGMFDENSDFLIEYEENDKDFRAFGEYEDSDDPDVTTGDYELIIKKDKSKLTYEDDAVSFTIKIGDLDY